MADPYFCELYIDTDENIDDLKRVVDALVREEFSDVSVSAPVYRNDNSYRPPGHGFLTALLNAPDIMLKSEQKKTTRVG